MVLIDRLRRAGVVVATTVALLLGGVALAPAATAAVPAASSGGHSSYNHYEKYRSHQTYKKECRTYWKSVGWGKYKHWKKVRVCHYVPVHRSKW